MSRISENFFNKIKNYSVALFIGNEISDDDVKNYYSRCEWDLVITTRKNADFYKNFETEKCSPVVFNWNQIPKTSLFYGEEMPVIHLCGFESEQEVNEDDQADALSFIIRQMTYHKQLVVTGISEDDAAVIDQQSVRRDLRFVPDESVSFWDVDSSFFKENFLKICNTKQFEFYEKKIKDIILEYEEDCIYRDEDFPVESSDDYSFYYKGGRPVSFDQKLLSSWSEKIGTILTEKTFHNIDPTGYYNLPKYFSKFLEESSYEPQWYGYIPQAGFRVKRSFEDRLYDKVKESLNGKSTKPVLLKGAPGSSKSITLAAIAYRIFKEKQNPVIYIKHEMTGLDSYKYYNEICNVMSKIGDSDNRILIVWDHTLVNPKNSLDDFTKKLEDSGRRFAILGCCYDTLDDDGIASVVESTRELDDDEIRKLWEIVERCSDINKQTIEELKKSLKDEKDVFAIFYEIITEKRKEKTEKNLRKFIGLFKKEELAVYSHIADNYKTPINTSITSNTAKTTVLHDLLKKAGYLNEDFEVSDKYEDSKDITEKLIELNEIVALFSRFGLSLPVDIGFRIFFGADNGNFVYSSKNQHIFKTLYQIPWYRFSNSDKYYSFFFRIPLEGEIYIEKNRKLSTEDQVNLLCKVIEMYGKYHLETRCKDENFTYNLQNLIRLMGPNSNYFGITYKGDIISHLPSIYRCIKDNIIGKENIRNIVDDDGSYTNIYATFVREYWSGKDLSDEAKEELVEVITKADAKRREIDEKNIDGRSLNHYIKQRNSLINEIIRCSIRLVEKDCMSCKHFGDLYELAKTAINSDPRNGYVYNSIFQAFLAFDEYDERDNDISKLKNRALISELMFDYTNLGDGITNKSDSDKLAGDIIQKIYNENISIESILNDSDSMFGKLYKNEKSPAPVIYICLNELKGIYNKFDPEIKEHIEKVKKVYAFLNEKNNYERIKNEAYSMDFLIRISWMLFNKKVLSSKEERQVTHITPENWVVLFKHFENHPDSKNSPFISLVHALTILQVGNLTDEAFKDAKNYIPSRQLWSDTHARMRTPFLICNENGEANNEFKGRVSKDSNGKMNIILKNGIVVRFRNKDLGLSETPRENDLFENLELGIGFTGFSAYTEEGRGENHV